LSLDGCVMAGDESFDGHCECPDQPFAFLKLWTGSPSADANSSPPTNVPRQRGPKPIPPAAFGDARYTTAANEDSNPIGFGASLFSRGLIDRAEI
jgi:hypothetical protein